MGVAAVAADSLEQLVDDGDVIARRWYGSCVVGGKGGEQAPLVFGFAGEENAKPSQRDRCPLRRFGSTSLRSVPRRW